MDSWRLAEVSIGGLEKPTPDNKLTMRKDVAVGPRAVY